MGLNRMMMGNTGTKNIEASLTIGYRRDIAVYAYGFQETAWKLGGSLSPNPLPNGIEIDTLAVYGRSGECYIDPTNITVTINGVQIRHGEKNTAIRDYMAANVHKTIPVVFHF